MAGHEWRRLAAVAASVAFASAAACRGGNGANDSAIASGDVVPSDSAATATTPSMAPAPASGATGTAMTITGGDPEILNVLAIVDQAEVQDGQLAQRQARNAKVKSFAREIVQSHTQSLQKDRQIAKSANVELMKTSTTARDSARTSTDSNAAANTGMSNGTGVAAQLEQMHTQAMERLRSLKGADFDSAFVNAQVMAHQQVLDLLQRSQSQAQNSDVQNHMTEAVKVVQTHLDKGRELQQSLMNGGTGAMGDSASKSKSDTARRS